ncbi:MAG: MFS transporter [Gemmatimonadetes bacterium]|nr:MAG: MFS transporter [Gemmatimonadota bacterium]
MLFVALTAPLMGAIADMSGIRKRMMMLYTAVCVTGVALFATLDQGDVLLGFTLAVIANIGFEGALVFYNAYLPDIAPPAKQGFVSGLGFGVGYLGSLVGLGVALPLAFANNFEAIWLAVAGMFAVFSLPTFLILPEGPARMSVRQAAVEGFTGFRRIVGEVLADRQLRRFLLAFFFYIDGVLTVILFAGPFAQTTMGFTATETIILFAVVQVSALVGALGLARPTDVWGPKRVISLSLLLWIAIAAVTFVIHTKAAFFAVAVTAGIGLGAIQAASRSFMAALTPEGKEAEMFGFYAFCGKSSSILGPFVFGTISSLTGGNQRLSIFSLIAFFVIGLLLLQRVEDPRRKAVEAPAP